jgi:putative acetyltransferase
MEIRIDDLRGPEIAELLQEHLDEMFLHSPPESVNALDLERLRQPNITFWTVWDGGELLGCGALKALDETHGEVKSMCTAAKHQRKGVAARLMRHILQTARERGYRRLSLETGSPDAFQPARTMYERFGFEQCAPFGDYVEDPYSVFMTIEL